MKRLLTNLSAKWGRLKKEDGKDLVRSVEYALVMVLVIFVATAGMITISGNIGTALTNVGTRLTMPNFGGGSVSQGNNGKGNGNGNR